jgi:signal transduction histidine kinase/ActR/RegA family two-component response regulator
MNEITSIQAQVDKFALSLASRVQRIYDALHQLAHLTEVAMALVDPAAEAVDAWLAEDEFTLERGFFESRRALRIHHGEGRDPGVFSHFWTGASRDDSGIRRRLYALRQIYPQVAALQASLPGVAWMYYQEPSNVALCYPFLDMSTLVDDRFDWRGHHTFRSVPAGERRIRWTPPNVDYGGQGLIATASLPLYSGKTFSGLWSIDVPLRTIHQNCIQERLAPEQDNFIVDHQGQIVVHGAIAGEIDPELGSVLRRHVSSLGGDFAGLDLAELVARGSGRLELHDRHGELLEVVFANIPDIDWLFVATLPQRGLLQAISTQIAEAFEHVRQGDLSYRIEAVAPAGMQTLVDGYNAMTEVLATQMAERERAEEALAAEKERLAVTLMSIADGVVATDNRGRVVLFNRAAERLTGWTAELAIGRAVTEVLPVGDRDGDPATDPAAAAPWRQGNPPSRYANRLAEALARPESRELPTTPLELLTRHGKPVLIRASSSPIRQRSGRPLGQVIVFHDVTAEQRVAEELLRASKLESIGVLAGGIAHDFNNLLTAIVGNVSLTLADASLPSDSAGLLREAERACYRARDLALQLLTFARGGAPIRRTASLPDLLHETTRFVLRGSGVEPHLELAPELLPVDIDEGQISQVLNNLTLNAIQAMSAGGRLTVRAENINLFIEGGDPVSLRSGRYVKISVCDTGRGIAPEHLDRIFDPYFTTKPGGSGLGLATSYSIVKHHGGALTVESTLGKGSCFHVYLPASRSGGGTVSPAVAPGAPAVLSGTGRILVMDDEEPVRVLLGRMLELLGYQPTLAADGAAAVEVFTAALADGQPFVAAVLDLTVPGGIGGVETLRQMRGLDPRIAAIASSGYSNDPVMADPERHRFDAVLPKPFDVSQLAHAMAVVMAPARRPLAGFGQPD